MITARNVLRWLWLLTAMLPCAASGAGAAGVAVDDARIRLPLPGQSSAVIYLSLHNGGESDLVLTAVEVDGFSRAEMHEHRHEDGLMKMREVDRIVVPAGDGVHFRPHHYHIMAFAMQEPAAQERRQGYSVRIFFAGGDSVATMAIPIR